MVCLKPFQGGPEVYPLLLLVFYKLIVLSKERAVAYMLS